MSGCNTRDWATLDFKAYAPALTKFEQWLRGQSNWLHRKWLERLNSHDHSQREAAISEALVWDFLMSREIICVAGDELHDGHPDFRCYAIDGTVFDVEVTNLSRESITRDTHLAAVMGEAGSGAKHYRLPYGRVKSEVSAKAKKKAGSPNPLVVFVTTLHAEFSAVGIGRDEAFSHLVARPTITAPVDLELGEVIGDLSSGSDLSLPLFYTKQSLDPARRNVSAVVMAGLGLVPPDRRLIGISHPDPVRPFNPALLVDVPFVGARVEQEVVYCEDTYIPPLSRRDEYIAGLQGLPLAEILARVMQMPESVR